MAVTDHPTIITSRFGREDAHTLSGYLASGGYEGLRAALAKTPQTVGDEVKGASLLGRGGAGYPAGTKWGFCPPGVWPACTAARNSGVSVSAIGAAGALVEKATSEATAALYPALRSRLTAMRIRNIPIR